MSAPRDLDEESLSRLARSFYLVKMVRYAALLVSVLLIGALALGEDAPGWVPGVLVALAAAFVAAMLVTRRRYLSARRTSTPGLSAPSPRG